MTFVRCFLVFWVTFQQQELDLRRIQFIQQVVVACTHKVVMVYKFHLNYPRGL